MTKSTSSSSASSGNEPDNDERDNDEPEQRAPHRSGQGEAGRKDDLPDEASIVEEKSFVSPKGRAYRIIRTNEGDEYDTPEDRKA